MRINLLIILLLFAFHAGLQAKDSKNISFKKTVEKIASKDDSALSEARAEIAVILAE
ncbi:MAG: hypothetical protein FJ088_15905, partial [Deltaproteobacteria bacterium]|nr:hypothetical protein [Deltaproteobacteria bacterium]